MNNINSSNNKKLEKVKEKDYGIFKKKFIHFRKILIYKIIIFIYFGPILSKEISYSKIILKFNSIYEIKILGNINSDGLYDPGPDEVYINGQNQSKIQPSYNNNENVNNVTLIWKKKINTTNGLFYQCEKIAEIDLSHFDASEVTSMSEMFSGCTELTSVNLANFNASKIIATQNIFQDCQDLKYINFNKAILKDSNEFDNHIFDLMSQHGTDNFVLCINDEKKWTKSTEKLANKFFNCTNNLTINDDYKCYGRKSYMTNEEICSISRITNDQEETINNYIIETTINNLDYKTFSTGIISSSYNADSLINKSDLVKNIKDDLINNCNISEINN